MEVEEGKRVRYDRVRAREQECLERNSSWLPYAAPDILPRVSDKAGGRKLVPLDLHTPLGGIFEELIVRIAKSGSKLRNFFWKDLVTCVRTALNTMIR